MSDQFQDSLFFVKNSTFRPKICYSSLLTQNLVSYSRCSTHFEFLVYNVAASESPEIELTICVHRAKPVVPPLATRLSSSDCYRCANSLCLHSSTASFFTPRAHLFDAAIAVRVKLLAEVETYPVAAGHIVLIEIIVFLLESIR